MMLRARRIVTFKPSGNLCQKTNGTYKYWWQKEEYQIKYFTMAVKQPYSNKYS